MSRIASFLKPSGFCEYQWNFLFLLQFLFVWVIYYTFSCVTLLIYWFFNRFFHETRVDQSFGKLLLFELTSKLLIFVVSKFHIANQCLQLILNFFLPVVNAPSQHNDVNMKLLWRHNNEFICNSAFSEGLANILAWICLKYFYWTKQEIVVYVDG